MVAESEMDRLTRRKKRDYSNIRVPVVALFEFPRTSLSQLRAGDPMPRNDEERALLLEFAQVGKAIFDRWEPVISCFSHARPMSFEK